MSPFSLSGPEFLLFFVVAGLVAAGATVALRRLVARPGVRGDPAARARRLHPAEAAFLVRDLERAVEAAVVGLHHQGAIELDGATLRPTERLPALEPEGVFRGRPARDRRSPVEDFVLSRLPATMSELCEQAREAHLGAELEARLEREGLLVEDPERAASIVRLPALAWLATGAIKLLVGIARDRPIEALLVLLVGGGALFLVLARAPRLTSLGRAVVQELSSLASLELTAETAPQQLSAAEMSLAYAIFGHAVAPAAIMTLMPSYHVAVAAAAASSSGTGSSCGGGGGGCGGGGGGGCGGCGGCGS